MEEHFLWELLDGAKSVDALPYVDRFSDAEKARAEQLVAAEMQTFSADDKNYLAAHDNKKADVAAASFLTPTLRAELERCERGERLDVVDLSRYDLKQTQQDKAEKKGRKRGRGAAADGDGADDDEQQALARRKHAILAFEYEKDRRDGLMLAERYGKAAWLAHCETREQQVATLEARRAELTAAMHALHVRRKQTQLAAHLDELEQEYTEAVRQLQLVRGAVEKLESQ